MLNRLPKDPPSLAELMADLGHPSPEAVAKALGVCVTTVRRWKRNGAPRSALLALWWLSRWGQSAWDCEMRQRQALQWRTPGAVGLDDAATGQGLPRALARLPGRGVRRQMLPPGFAVLPWGAAPAP